MKRTPSHPRNPTDASRNATPDVSTHRAASDPGRRRRLLAAITAAGATSAALPDRWNRPVVDAVLLPAHAQATPAACGLTCTSEIQETWVLEQVNNQVSNLAVNGLSRATIVQCISDNGAIAISSTSFQDSGFDAMGRITNLAFSGGTISTAFILSTGTSITDTHANPTRTFVTVATSTGFQSAC